MKVVADVIDALERIAPPHLAASWDNTGLLLGDRRLKVSRVLTCLTLTEEVANEAANEDCQLVVTHHPILFRGAKRIIADEAEGRSILRLASANISVYSPHTSFDDGPGGINEQLALGLGVTKLQPLRNAPAEDCKLVVFVPEGDLGKVSDAIFAAGAGVIGQYRECSFRLTGQGTFFGSGASNPTVGQKDRREVVTEYRLETVCPKSKVASVIAALRAAHSYEEPAFDVYPLMSTNQKIGSGRVGELPTPMKLDEFAEKAKRFLKTPIMQLVGERTRSIQRVAVACGAAGEFLDDARNARADLFVTGEMRFHDYLSANAMGIVLLLPGHYATERFAVENLATWINENVSDVHAQASARESDPITIV
jgi:dinuclear metal center YbgI/SA1388 family protein